MDRARTSFVAWLICAALAWRAECACAQAPFVLNWVRGEGAETCVSGPELQAKLREVLSAASVSAGALVLEGVVERDASDQFRVYLHVLGANGTPLGSREFHSAERECARLTPSIVLVLSFLIELGAREVEITAPAPPRSPIETGHVAWPKETPPREVARELARWQLEPRALLALGLGLLPGAALGPMLGLHVRTPWPLALLWRAAYWPDARTLAKASSVGADFQVFAADLGVCLPALTTADWWLGACWGPAIILRRAESVGLPERRDSLRASFAAEATLQLTYAPTPHWFLAFDASLLGVFRRDSYFYEQADHISHAIYRTSQLAGQLALGLGFRP